MSDLRCLKYEDALWGLEVNRAAQAVRVGSGRSAGCLGLLAMHRKRCPTDSSCDQRGNRAIGCNVAAPILFVPFNTMSVVKPERYCYLRKHCSLGCLDHALQDDKERRDVRVVLEYNWMFKQPG